MHSNPFRLAVICGGPSHERGISLNSARSVSDHLQSSYLSVIPLYVDREKQFYQISPGQLYSNTPSDFDYKLKRYASKLNSSDLIALLKSVDCVFPVIHGAFGEDGELQAFLEAHQIPFVGSSSTCCQWMFHKHRASETLRGHGFATLPQALLFQNQKYRQEIERFFLHHHLKRGVVKPAFGGSSIGVFSVSTASEAYEKAQEIFVRGLCNQVIIEPFCEGKEFTVVVFQNVKGQPVALLPTEVALSYEENQIFDYRKKYLPTNQAAYHTPPRFSKDVVEHIRWQAEQIFTIFGMHDFVRLDGWLMPNGTLYFTDINPISGMEQNSFLFRQAAAVGLGHRQTLEYILRNACQRYEISMPEAEGPTAGESKSTVYVLFGSRNAERQVSLMSGTNVWLKLRQSHHHEPSPFLFDPQGDIWELPYALTLNHTVEEIYAHCLASEEEQKTWLSMIQGVCRKLGIEAPRDQYPKKMTLDQFLEKAAEEKAFVFIALHGGEGENGTLQRKLAML